MPSITICMIVRDEERLLPAFLAGVEGCFDQLVAIDTGSLDGTVDLLRGVGAEVHAMPWQDDFALARNESLRHARGDFVLVLDADEFATPAFRDELRAVVADDRCGAATILRADEQRNGILRHSRPLRLFRRDPSIRYRCRIHEDASASIGAMLQASGRRSVRMEAPVRHVGYLPGRMDERDKATRDERLLRLALADDGDDLYSRYKLLELYRFWQRAEPARSVALDCLGLLDGGAAISPPHIAGDLLDMMRLALFGSDDRRGLAFMETREALAGHTGHYHLSVGALLENTRAFAEAGRRFRRALDLAGNDPARLYIETRALMGLTRLALASGDMAAARTTAAAAHRLSPDDGEVRLVTAFLASLPGG